jgi:transposase
MLHGILVEGSGQVVRRRMVSRWACRLRARAGWQRASVALANKNARHLWALLSNRFQDRAAH